MLADSDEDVISIVPTMCVTPILLVHSDAGVVSIVPTLCTTPILLADILMSVLTTLLVVITIVSALFVAFVLSIDEGVIAIVSTLHESRSVGTH